MKHAAAVMRSPSDVLWITPEGRFTDVRDCRGRFSPGLAHLCQKTTAGVAIPLAMEYTFWNERLPVCLLRFGAPLPLGGDPARTKCEWQTLLENELRNVQDKLAGDALDRSLVKFDDLVLSRGGSGFFYDSVRRIRSLLTGQKLSLRHEQRT